MLAELAALFSRPAASDPAAAERARLAAAEGRLEQTRAEIHRLQAIVDTAAEADQALRDAEADMAAVARRLVEAGSAGEPDDVALTAAVDIARANARRAHLKSAAARDALLPLEQSVRDAELELTAARRALSAVPLRLVVANAELELEALKRKVRPLYGRYCRLMALTTLVGGELEEKLQGLPFRSVHEGGAMPDGWNGFVAEWAGQIAGLDKELRTVPEL